MSKLRRQMSYNASLSTIVVTSVCSSNEWTQRTVLYGSTTAVATWGQAHTVKLNFDFFFRSPRKGVQASNNQGLNQSHLH